MGKDAQSGCDVLEEVEANVEGLDQQPEGDFDSDVPPSEQAFNDTSEASSGARKRKRTTNSREDVYTEVIKEVCVTMGDKFGAATANLAQTIAKLAHKTATKEQASGLWAKICQVQGLTKDELYAGYFKILGDEMLLNGFLTIPEDEKAEWVRRLLG